jgi:16S rRNA (cytidine1402-2'-O)-methyltransferase
MEDIVAVLGSGRRVVVARELTKVHEEFLRGTAGQLSGELEARADIKGEITLLIGPASEQEIQPPPISIRERVEQIMREEKLHQKDALKKVARERSISKSEAYREWQRS